LYNIAATASSIFESTARSAWVNVPWLKTLQDENASEAGVVGIGEETYIDNVLVRELRNWKSLCGG
jgi:hypothetical protein